MRRYRSLLFCAVIAAMLLGPVACEMDRAATVEQVTVAAQVLTDTRAELAAAEAKLAAIEAATPPGTEPSPEVLAMRKAVAKLGGFADQLTMAMQAYLAKLNDPNATDETVIAGAAEGIIPFIPPPWDALIGLGVGLLMTLRANRNRENARRLAATVEPIIRAAIEADPKIAGTLRVAQPLGVRRLVDESQGGKVPLPV